MKVAVAVLRSAVGAFALVGMVVLAGCGGGGGGGQDKSAELIGDWGCVDVGDVKCEETIHLDSDGTGGKVGTDESGSGYMMQTKWKIANGRLVISAVGTDFSYKYKMKSDTLILIDDNGKSKSYTKSK
jgi:hypothetical protein